VCAPEIEFLVPLAKRAGGCLKRESFPRSAEFIVGGEVGHGAHREQGMEQAGIAQIPLTYDDAPDAAFPFITICMPFENPGFLGLEPWAERNGALLIVMNEVSNATMPQNPEVQADVLTTAFKLLRLDPARGIAFGMSGGARTSWNMIRDYPDRGVPERLREGRPPAVPRSQGHAGPRRGPGGGET